MTETEDICRVCRSGPQPHNPLYYPCRCLGSIRYVHEECLQTWLKHSGKHTCELCGHEFIFLPIYRETMPSTLPVLVLFRGISARMHRFGIQLFRYILVGFSWCIFVPLTTGCFFLAVLELQSNAVRFIPETATMTDFFYALLCGTGLTLGTLALVFVLILLKGHAELGLVDPEPQTESDNPTQVATVNHPRSHRTDWMDESLGLPIDEFLGLEGKWTGAFVHGSYMVFLNILVSSVLFFTPLFIGETVRRSASWFQFVTGAWSHFQSFLPGFVGNQDIFPHISPNSTSGMSISWLLGILAVYGSLRAGVGLCGGNNVPLKQGLAALETIARTIVLLFAELVVCPILYGWFVSHSLGRFFDPDHSIGELFAQKLVRHSQNPHSSHLIHWDIGLCFVLLFSFIITISRQNVRKGLLHFIRNPNDPDHNPFRDLVSISLVRQLKRILFSIIAYALVVLCVAEANVLFYQWIGLGLESVKQQSLTLTDLLALHLSLPALGRIMQSADLWSRGLGIWLKYFARYLSVESFALGENSKIPKVVFVKKMPVWEGPRLYSVSRYSSPSMCRRPGISGLAVDLMDQKYINPQHLPEKESYLWHLDRDPLLRHGFALVPNFDRHYSQDEWKTLASFPLTEEAWAAFQLPHCVLYQDSNGTCWEDNPNQSRPPSRSEKTYEISTLVFKPRWFRFRMVLYLGTIWIYLSATIFGFVWLPLFIGQHVLEGFGKPVVISEWMSDHTVRYITGGIILSGLSRILAHAIQSLKAGTVVPILKATCFYTFLFGIWPFISGLLINILLSRPLPFLCDSQSTIHIHFVLNDHVAGIALISLGLYFLQRRNLMPLDYQSISMAQMTRQYLVPITLFLAGMVVFPPAILALISSVCSSTFWLNSGNRITIFSQNLRRYTFYATSDGPPLLNPQTHLLAIGGLVTYFAWRKLWTWISTLVLAIRNENYLLGEHLINMETET